MWASRSKPKKALDLHPMADILLQSLVFFPQRCRNRLLQPSASSGVVLHSSAKRYPADGQAIPPLRTSYYSLPSVGPPRTRTSQVSHSSPSATPLPRLPHLRVVPVWGLAVVHRLGALAWRGQHMRVIERGLYVESLTAGTHEVHGRTQGKFLLITHCTWEGLLYFTKKTFPPLTGRTHQLYLRTQGSASLLRTKKMNTPY